MFKENEFVELKKSTTQLKEGVISVSAMLNKHSKAELYFGINDEGKVFNIEVGRKTLSDISREFRNHLKPYPVRLEINEMSMDGKSIIKVYAEGADQPYSAYGRYYTRIDDTDSLMNSNQLQVYFENKEHNYSKWENIETNYTIDDINEDLLIECIREANDTGRLNYIYRNPEEALKKLNLINENNKLNMAGYYLFGKNKPITVKVAYFPTDSRIEFGEIKEISGNIFECINDVIAYILNHISYKADIIGYKRVETPEIPIKAIREIVINSFAHCKYSIKEDFNQYIIQKSSISIYNPGSIYKNLDPKQFASSVVGSKIRNILISSVLYKCGYIDAFGTGFDRTFTLCDQNKIKYRYINDEFGFKFIFERNINFLNKIKKEKNIEKANTIDDKIIECIRDNKYITIPEISLKVNKSEPTIYRHIEKLASNNLIKRVGSRKNGYWKLN